MLHELFIVGTALLAIPLGFSFVCRLIARIGPWRRLAEHYPEVMLLDAEHHRFVSLRCGWASYGNCLNASVTEDYLTLVPMRLFRSGHPPFTLPRGDIRDVCVSHGLGGASVRFSVAEFHLTLYGRVAESVFFQ